MKVAVFTDTYLPQVNGVTNTLSRLKKYMENNNIEHKFFIPYEKEISENNRSIITFDSLNFFLYPECKMALPRYVEVNKILKKFNPDIIHIVTQFSLGLVGLKYARNNNIPIICSYHTDIPGYLKHYNLDFFEKPVWKYFSWFHSFSPLNLCPSKSTLQQLKDKGIEGLRLWGRGIDTSSFNPLNENKALKKSLSPNGEKILLYVGRLAPEKEIPVLAKAAIKLNKENIPFKILLVGDGPARKELEGFDIPNTIFTGYKSGKDLQEIYAASDIFVFPSSTETYGNVVLEAMASGLPVIAPFSGGVKENLVPGTNGMSFNIGDSEDFAIKIKELLVNNNLRKCLSQNARNHSLKKSWSKVFDNLVDYYNEAIKLSIEKSNRISA